LFYISGVLLCFRFCW